MTETLIYGIAYRRDGEMVIEGAESLESAMDAVRELLGEQGLSAEIVSGAWKVDPKASLLVKRDIVEETLNLLVTEEFGEEEAASRLQYLSSGLLSDAEVTERREQGVHVNDECTMAIWLERAANHYRDRIDPPDGRDTNDESFEADYLFHLDVLAGIEDHGRAEYDCSACGRRVVKAVA